MAGDLTVGQLRVILEADSSEFAAAMKDASADTKKLADTLKKDLEPSQRGINKAFKDFLGSNEIKKAQEMAAAVQKMGGVTNLTTAQQLKLNQAVTKAIDQYKALGATAPQSLTSLQKATENAAKPMSMLDQGIAAIGPRLMATFGVGAVVGTVTRFATAILETAGHVQDLAEKMDVSAETVQRWESLFRESGATIDQVAGSLTFMQRTLATGAKDTVAALDAMGLKLADIRAMKTEEAFEAIAEGIRSIKDPAEQVRVGTELLGRGFTDLLPAIREGVKGAGDEFAIMSNEAISMLDTIGDAFSRFGPRFKAIVVNDLMTPLTEWNNLMNSIRPELSLPGNIPSPGAFQAPTIDVLPDQAGIDARVKAQDALNKTTEKAIEKAEEYRKAIAALADTWTGASLDIKARDLTNAYLSLTDAQQEDTLVIAKLVKEIDKLMQSGGKLTPQLLKVWEAHGKLVDIRRVEEKLLLDLASRESAYSTILGKTGTNLQIVSTEQQAMLRANAQELIQRDAQRRGLEEYNQYLEHSAYLTSVATAETEAAGPAVRELGTIWKTVGDAITGGLVQIISGARSFKDGMVSIFNSMVTQILGDFTNRFVSGIVKALMGGKGALSQAFEGVFGGIGAKAASLFNSNFMNVFKGAGWIALGTWAGALLYKWFRFGFGSGDKYTPPNFPSGGGPDPNNPNNPYVDPEGNPYQPGDPNANVPDPNLPPGTSEPDWSHLPGFARGTNWQFPDWGTGTPVMLHGREAIVPMDAAIASEGLDGGSVSPIYLTLDSRVLGEVSARSDSRAASRFGLMRS